MSLRPPNLLDRLYSGNPGDADFKKQ